MIRIEIRTLALTLALMTGLATPVVSVADEPEIKLVVQITVDQLRGDMPARYAKHFGAGGFKRLMNKGVWYSNAHYRHATTFTAVGHASLFTGGNPQEHGLVGNNWINRETLERVYCVEDPAHTILGVPKQKKHQGSSPRNLLSSTIGDELYLATAGASKVFSVSIKDRGAILPGGQRGKAFWFHKKTGQIVTSSYYYKKTPAWLDKFNKAGALTPYLGKKWELALPKAEYIFAKQDDRKFERAPKGFDVTFPHDIPKDMKKAASVIATTPMGDQMIEALAETVIKAEKLGKRDATDFLAVSFSVTDYVGHAFGPNSLESEDNQVHLDRTLEKFLNYLDAQIGLDRCLVVLSSDHGCDASPEHRKAVYQASQAKKSAKAEAQTPKKEPAKKDASKKEPVKKKPAKKPAQDKKQSPKKPRHYFNNNDKKAAAKQANKDESPYAGLPTDPDYCCQGGRHDVSVFVKALNRHLSRHYKTPAKLASNFYNPSVYLDLKVIQALALPLEDVERQVANFMRNVPGIALALTRTDIMSGQVLRTELSNKLLKSFNPARSGNVLIVQRPFWYLAAYNGVAAMHGSPYNYDTHVPVFFYNPRMRSNRVVRRVAPEDIASTLAQFLNVPAPSGSTGEPLAEVFSFKRQKAKKKKAAKKSEK